MWPRRPASLTLGTMRSSPGSDSLDLSHGPLLGTVVRVEPGSAVVEVTDPALATRATVSDLVAARGPSPDHYLVALIEAATSGPGGEAGANDGAAGVIRIVLVGTFLRGGDVRPDVFTRGAQAFPKIGADCHLVEGEQLRRFMSILGESVPPDERLALGRFVAEQDAIAIADGNRMFQRHMGVLGSTGTGKSWAVALMLERAARLAHSNMIVFDMHGEYRPLTQGEAGLPPIARSLRIAGPGDIAEPADDVIFLPYWLLDRDEMLSLVLDPTDPDAPSQAMRFADHVYKLKRSTLHDIGREDIAATFTVDSPVPYRLDTLMTWLNSDDLEKIVRQPSGEVVPGPYASRLTRFIARLDARIADGRYGFMFHPPEDCLDYEWLERFAASLLDAGGERSGIKVIDFSEVPAEALPVVAGVIARLIYDVQFWMDPAERTPVCFVCDEAHLYLPVRETSDAIHQQALRAFEEIAKEGRKYGVGLVIVSQRPADVSRTVVSQCNNFVVMRLTNDRDQAVIEQLVPDSLSRMTDVLPLLDVGEAVVLGDALLLPTRLKFDPPEIKPSSATRPFWSDWAAQPTDERAIISGVEALRRQIRPEGWSGEVIDIAAGESGPSPSGS